MIASSLLKNLLELYKLPLYISFMLMLLRDIVGTMSWAYALTFIL